jgi:TonB-linked SusC/RagA family outer membrane protein
MGDRQLMSIMKRTLVFLVIFMLTFATEASAMGVSMSLRNVKVEKVLSAITKQTGLSVAYSNQIVDLDRRVSIRVEDADVSIVLEKLVANTNLGYEIRNEKIYLFEKQLRPAAPATDAAQQMRQVSGKITDPAGEPVVGANVAVKGTTRGTVSGVNGDYQLEVPQNGVLVFSGLGYITREIAVNNQSVIDVVFAEDTQMLDEVVVLGYGANMRKQDLSASVGVISNTENLTIRPIATTAGMLQGQLAGVTVQENGGDPTGGPSIVIRGQGSQRGDGVLWVVDGVPGAPIASTSDIESIIVLKDAASAAIYGAQSGAGGVILVTTKKAREGQLSLTYDGTYGLRQSTNLIQPLDAQEQLKMRQLSYANAGLTLPVGWDTSRNPWIATTRTNWMDEIFRTSFFRRHNMDLSGGSENFRNRISLSYNDNQGTLINTYSKSLALRYNGAFKLNKWLTIREEFVWRTSQGRSTDTSSAQEGTILSALYMPSSASVYNPLDGTYGGTTTEDPNYIAQYGSNFADIHGDVVNPVRLLEAANVYNKVATTHSSTNLEIANLVPGLKFNSRFTYTVDNGYNKVFTPIRDEVGKPNNSNSLVESTYRGDAWKTENTLTYDNSFGKHTVSGLVSTTADHFESRGFSVTGTGLSDESNYLQYLSYASMITGSDYLTGPDANISLVARAAYSYDDRYFVTASWRRDYASRLPTENNFGDFPALTAAWKISNESFFPKSDVLNLLKFRASWGRVGNLGSIGNNYKSATLGKFTYIEQAQWGVSSNQTWGAGLYNYKAVNPLLTWETSQQWDVGLDINMFKNRLSMQLDYFDKRTFNLIQPQTMNWPTTIGLEAMLINQGEIRNRGFEAQVSWSDRINKDFSYFMSGNFSYLKNRVSDIGVKRDDGTAGVWTGGGAFRNIPYVYQTAEGGELNSFYLIESAGIFQSDREAAAYVGQNGARIQPNAQAGDLKFVDLNNDGKIDDKDRQYFGSATPATTFALSAGITYKNLSVSVMFQGVGGAQAFYAGKYMTVGDVDGNFNRSKDILNAWSPTNTGSDIPRLSKNDPNGNFATASTWYLEDASYLRLKNLTISYDLTNALRKSAHLNVRDSRFSVYFSGENLFTATKYSGMDPECGGYDGLKYPVSRVFSFGLRLTY